MRLMISGGGTGGHVYPALTVVKWLTSGNESGAAQGGAPLTCLWVGSEGGVERALVERAEVPFVGIRAAGLRGQGAYGIARGLTALTRGFWQARRLVASFRPEVLFVTGGYVCGPVVWAAWLARVPVLIYLPDVEPGLAIRSLARFARRVAISAGEAARFFRPGQTVVTGYPVRPELFSRDRAVARHNLALTSELVPGEDVPVLLVMGGSQGAHSINRAVCEGLAALLDVAQVIHVTGRRDAEWVQTQRSNLPESVRARYHIYDYLDELMVDALLAADLVVARAGASTLGELPAVGVPGVLVPYRYAGAHQSGNARLLVDAGAAVVVADEAAGVQLVATVIELLADDERRASMGRAMRSLGRPDAAAHIARELKELAS